MPFNLNVMALLCRYQVGNLRARIGINVQHLHGVFFVSGKGIVEP